MQSTNASSALQQDTLAWPKHRRQKGPTARQPLGLALTSRATEMLLAALMPWRCTSGAIAPAEKVRDRSLDVLNHVRNGQARHSQAPHLTSHPHGWAPREELSYDRI